MNKNVKVSNPMKVITGPDTRWSYANVWEPKSINGGTPKYSVSLIIPKSDTKTIAKIEAAIEAAYKEGEAKLKGNGKSVPALSVIKTPLRDGDMERPDDPAYAGSSMLHLHRVLWTQTAILSLLALRFTPVCTVVPASTSMLSIALAIRESPAALTICRRFVMVSLLAARHLLSLISHLMKMTISLINGGGDYGNVTGYSRCHPSCYLVCIQYRVPYHCGSESHQ